MVFFWKKKGNAFHLLEKWWMLKQEENLWAISIEENGTSHEFFMELEKYPDPSIFLAKTPNAFTQSLPRTRVCSKKTSGFFKESLNQKSSNSYFRWVFSWVIHCHRKPEAFGRSITSSQNRWIQATHLARSASRPFLAPKSMPWQKKGQRQNTTSVLP